MINIEDIRIRLANNPEPIEVTEGRKLILDRFKDIEFVEETHQYFLPQSDGSKKELASVSATIERFEQYVDWDEKCELKAAKLGIPKEELAKEWYQHNHLATTSGSVHHEYGECFHYLLLGQPENITDRFKIQYEGGYLFPSCPKQEASMKFNEDLFSVGSMYSVLAEARVYSEELGYSGTFDKLVYFKHPTDDTKSGYIVFDYKTNTSLSSSYNRNNGICMLPPFDDMIDEALSHYTAQLSAYQIPLEDIGLKVIGRRIIWLKDDGTYEKISLPDVTGRLREALKQK